MRIFLFLMQIIDGSGCFFFYQKHFSFPPFNFDHNLYLYQSICFDIQVRCICIIRIKVHCFSERSFRSALPFYAIIRLTGDCLLSNFTSKTQQKQQQINIITINRNLTKNKCNKKDNNETNNNKNWDPTGPIRNSLGSLECSVGPFGDSRLLLPYFSFA